MYSPHRRPIDRVVSWPALPSRVSLCVNYFLVKILSASKVVYAKAYWPTFRVISLLDLRSRHGAMFCHPPRACGVASHEGVFSCLRADVSYFLCRGSWFFCGERWKMSYKRLRGRLERGVTWAILLIFNCLGNMEFKSSFCRWLQTGMFGKISEIYRTLNLSSSWKKCDAEPCHVLISLSPSGWIARWRIPNVNWANLIINQNTNSGAKHCELSYFYKHDFSNAIQHTFSKVVLSDG